MGSMSIDCRTRMEIEATQEAIRFYQGETLHNPVPEEEYVMHMNNEKNGKV
jgi:D-3-phosphoglycerate dehydrogenase / 2-oxoglutarate reductase